VRRLVNNPRAPLPPAELKPEVMTLEEVAEYLDCSMRTIHRMLKAGELPAFRLRSRRWRIQRSDLNQWIRDRRSKPGDGHDE